MPLLSIIVPVYNVEKYLDECLESIANQTFNDIEVICVDDGSTDKSSLILNNWQKKDRRIVVLRQANKGVSTARNEALKLCNGKYVTCVDADDVVCGDIYSFSIGTMEHYELDAFTFTFKTFPFPFNRVEKSSFIIDKVLTPYQLLASNKRIQYSNSLCFNWRFIFRSTILKDNHIEYNPDIAIGEDMIYNTEALLHCRKVMASNRTLYQHRMDNPNSAMTKPFKPLLESSLTKMYQIKKEQIAMYNIDQYTPYSFDLAVYTINVYLPMFLRNIFANTKNIDKESEIKRILSLPMIRDACKIIGFKNVYTTWKEYIFYLLLKWQIHPILIKYYIKRHKQ